MTGNRFLILEILCASLNEVAFGQYQPSDCTEQKIMHGTNCTLTCAEGFEMKGPAVKTCGGKKTGIWSNRNKHPKCVGNDRLSNCKNFHYKKVSRF